MSVSLSLSEVDALCRKAARGAGYSWGVAEEAGRAARWLAAHRMAGPEALAAWLQRCTPEHIHQVPSFDGQCWHTQLGFCPLTAGTLVSDREAQLLAGGDFRLTNVQQPLLLLPLVARIAEANRQTIYAQIDGAGICCDGQSISCADFSSADVAADVRCSVDELQSAIGLQQYTPSSNAKVVRDDAFAVLVALAHRTYAPATEASRLAGAGSGLSDND